MKLWDVTSVVRTTQPFLVLSALYHGLHGLAWLALPGLVPSPLPSLPYLFFCSHTGFFAVAQTPPACCWIQAVNTYWTVFLDAFHPDACRACFVSSFRSLFIFHLIRGVDLVRGSSLTYPLWWDEIWTEAWRRRERKLGRYLFNLSSQRHLNTDWVFENGLFIFFYVYSSVLEKETRFLLSVMVKQ